jgi:hypothetical protein
MKNKRDKMQINNLFDIYNVENITLRKLFLNYDDIDKKKIIKFVKDDIDMSNFKISNDIENWIYYAIDFVKSRNEESLNKSFEYLYKILSQEHKNTTFIFAIVHMLFYVSKIYKTNLSNLIKGYKEIIVEIKDTVSFTWLVFPLVQNGICENDLIERVFESDISLSLKESLLEDIQYNSKERFEYYSINLANIIIDLAKNEKGMKADYYYGLVIEIYKKINKYDEIDNVKLLKKKLNLSEDINELDIEISTKELDNSIVNLKKQINTNIENKHIVKAFAIVFTIQSLPNANEIKNNLNTGIFTQLATIMPITAGRKGIVAEDKKEEYFFYEQYGMGLMSVYSYIFYNLLTYLQSKIDIKKIVLNIYQESLPFDNTRIELFDNIIQKFIDNDNIGFVYSIVPNIEYIIKEILKLNNISPHNRDIRKEEDVSLNSLIVSNKELLISLYGKNFVTLLEYFFTYEYGLNMRNGLLHGEGIDYLAKEYSNWLLYIFIILISYTRKVRND